jgi:UDP-N-acetylmuramoyl-tripeptide--D-alanyl-D-alanine ligase
MPDLWTFDDLVRAACGTPDGAPGNPITGFTIDSRTLCPGDVFVALKDRRDGHEFVTAAFAAGAAAALVAETYERKPGDGALVRVPDPLGALERIARAARARLAPASRVIAVTGSAGKTGTKEMLRACLARAGRVHASEKSYNNHWGVPLTLARMPPATQYAVLEIGMNHAGEISPLSEMVRPHVAVVTTVAPVHLAFFTSVEAIAQAKAEIFDGLEPGGTAVLPRDNAYFDLLAKRALSRGARVLSFGVAKEADVRAARLEAGPEHTDVVASCPEGDFAYRVGAPGVHLAENSLAVVASLLACGADVAEAVEALAAVRAQEGRGARIVLDCEEGPVLLIDESYNANPASMRAALIGLASVPRQRFGRRIAVLGDMLELGSDAPRLHADLKDAVDAAGVDLVFASGKNMTHLYGRLDESRRGAWAETSDGLAPALLERVRGGDVVMIKGSLGSRMGPLVEALKARFAPPAPAHQGNAETTAR